MKLLQELAKPSRRNNVVGVGDDMVLYFNAGVRHSVLVFGGPRHQVVAEENTVAEYQDSLPNPR
jgi:hypothetical protein